MLIGLSAEVSVANSAVFPRNWASFRPVPRGGGGNQQLRVAICWDSFYAHAAIFGLVSKVVCFTSCVHNKYCELPIESLLMFLNTDTCIAHSSLGHASTCPGVAAVDYVNTSSSLRSATCSNVMQT